MRQPRQGAQLPRAARLVGLTLAFLAAAAPAVADRTVAKNAQLDDDADIERVERRFVDCPEGLNAPDAPEMCGYIAIVDGERDVRLTPTTQRPRFDFGWHPYEPVLLRDLTGDGRPELVWDLYTSGGTGSSPRLFGVHRWTDGRAVRIFQRTNRRASRGRYAIPFTLKVLPPRRGLRELRVREGLYARGDSTCCPSFVRTTRHRWDGRRMKLVGTKLRRTRYAQPGPQLGEVDLL